MNPFPIKHTLATSSFSVPPPGKQPPVLSLSGTASLSQMRFHAASIPGSLKATQDENTPPSVVATNGAACLSKLDPPLTSVYFPL